MLVATTMKHHRSLSLLAAGTTTTLVVVALLLLCARGATGHAALTSPMGRQAYAKVFGSTSVSGRPFPVGDPMGWQAGGYTWGPCGRFSAGEARLDFTNNYVTSNGDPADWVTQAVYDEGEIIELEVTIQANHGGYFEYYVCTDVDNPTQECFDANPLEYVGDALYGAHAQEAPYQNRAYLAPEAVPGRVDSAGYLTENGEQWAQGYMVARHYFKLPEGISGEKVLLQMQWVTYIFDCIPPGSDLYEEPSDWVMPGYSNAICSVDSQGRMADAGNSPQRYWQCAEVEILQTTPTTSPRPTSSPVTQAPTTKAPTPSPTASAPVAPTTTPAPTDAPCGVCSGVAECNGKTENDCYHLINNDNKDCTWTPCAGDTPTPLPTNPPTAAPVTPTPNPTEPPTPAPVTPTPLPTNPPTPTPNPTEPPTPAPVTPTPNPTEPPTPAPVTPSPNPTSPPTPGPTNPPTPAGSCGECQARSGVNEPECNGQPYTQCRRMVDYEGKCTWNTDGCGDDTEVTCGICVPDPTANESQSECYSQTVETCIVLMFAEPPKCSYTACET